MPQTPSKNYYQLLELENFADLDQVKSAYRRLARQCHPDLNAGNKAHEERFKLINEAYEMVGTADKKAIYDDTLRARLKMASRVPPPQKKDAASQASTQSKTASNSQQAKDSTEKAPVNEFFESVRKAFSQEPPPPPPPYHQSKANKQKTVNSKRGQDVTVDALITASEAKEGVVKTVNVQHQDICKRCSGSGKLLSRQCPMCHGEKVITRLKKIDVRIPAGVKSGSKVRVAAEGIRGEQGGEAGDLFLQIQVSPEQTRQDEQLRVEGMDVYGELTIAITDAVLGTTVDVQTLHGLFKLTIPPLSSSGKMLRLKEQGVHAAGSKGDHYVTIRISVPENLSARERELYQELAQIHHQKQKHSH